MSIAGSTIWPIWRIWRNMDDGKVSSEMLPQEITTVTELMSYLCGVCMAICVALAALPILNASARAALNEKVTLVNEEE